MLGIADDSRVDVDAMALCATRSSSGDQAAASAAKVQESPQGKAKPLRSPLLPAPYTSGGCIRSDWVVNGLVRLHSGMVNHGAPETLRHRAP